MELRKPCNSSVERFSPVVGVIQCYAVSEGLQQVVAGGEVVDARTQRRRLTVNSLDVLFQSHHLLDGLGLLFIAQGQL